MMEGIFGKIKNQGWRIFIGGVIIAGLIFIFPPLYGEGYTTINDLLNGNVSDVLDRTLFYVDRENVWFIAMFIGAIAMFKAFATSATNGAGGVGRTFAPSLFVGALVGFLFAFILNNLDLGLTFVAEKFHTDGNGRSDGRSDARPTDGDIPHGGNDRRLQPLPAAADSLNHLISDNTDIHTLQYLHHAVGKSRRSAHASEGQERAHTA